ncbi:MAG: TolC family protein, partial [Armatimonadetes bacterium]|nr:TolC family protein [Armatimonadota bacterium]
MKHPHTLAILFVLVGCSLVHGANLPSDRPLTLQDCISYALENHNSVLAAQRELAASAAETRQAKAGYLPNMTVSSRHIRSDSK